MRSPAPIRPTTSTRNLPRVPPGTLVRVLLLAIVAVFACAFALVHMLTRKPVPMIAPAPPQPSEIPAPDTPE